MENKDYVIIGVLFMIFLYWGYGEYNTYKENKGWDEDEVCDYWVAYKEYPCPGIVLNNCARIDSEFNTFIEKCECMGSNKTAYRACQIKHEVKEFIGNDLFWDDVIDFKEKK